VLRSVAELMHGLRKLRKHLGAYVRTTKPAEVGMGVDPIVDACYFVLRPSEIHPSAACEKRVGGGAGANYFTRILAFAARPPRRT
jgi:hypothetical protein